MATIRDRLSLDATSRAHSRLETDAMKFLMLIKHAEAAPHAAIPQSLMDAMGEFVGKGLSSGVLKETAGLKPTADGFRIRSSGGRLQRTDGPFVETKEIVGGYAMVETATRAEAEEMAREFMELHRVHWPEFECECEVRPVEDM
jgi:hypothetical protein